MSKTRTILIDDGMDVMFPFQDEISCSIIDFGEYFLLRIRFRDYYILYKNEEKKP